MRMVSVLCMQCVRSQVSVWCTECPDTSAHLDVLHVGQSCPSDWMLGAWAHGLK